MIFTKPMIICLCDFNSFWHTALISGVIVSFIETVQLLYLLAAHVNGVTSLVTSLVIISPRLYNPLSTMQPIVRVCTCFNVFLRVCKCF